jgi:hypothetical protein
MTTSKVMLKPIGIGTGTSSTAKVIIKNIGKTVGLIGDISLTNDQAETAFMLSSPGPFNIPPHGTLRETITFTPDATSDSATITVTSNDPSKATINIPVTGTGLPGKLSAPKTLTITSKGVGVQGTANLILKNVGKGVLTDSVSAATAPFDGGGGSGSIPPHKANPPIVITFMPTSTAPVTSSITVTVDPPSTATTVVTLRGIIKK